MQSDSVAVTNVAWSAAGWVALLLLGASIASDLGAAQLTAANDLEVEAAQTRHDNSSEAFVKKSGILSTTKTTNRTTGSDHGVRSGQTTGSGLSSSHYPA